MVQSAPVEVNAEPIPMAVLIDTWAKVPEAVQITVSKPIFRGVPNGAPQFTLRFYFFIQKNPIEKSFLNVENPII